jgi:hypothetical protein
MKLVNSAFRLEKETPFYRKPPSHGESTKDFYVITH